MPPTEKRNLGSYEDAALTKAITLMISECFGAMCFANALGGSQTDKWKIIHDYKVDEIMSEAKKRGLLDHNLKAAIGPDTLATSRLAGYLTGDLGVVTKNLTETAHAAKEKH